MASKIVIYLASQSPRRSLLIRQAGHICRVVPSSYVEKHESHAHPRELVLRHARGKLAEAKIPPKARFLVAADTVVVLRGKIYGKPSNLAHAKRMLSKLNGKTHQVYTGWVMRDLTLGKQVVRCIRSQVKICPMTAREIQSYFQRMNPLDKAGSYAVQSRPSIVESIKGSYSNVMGLPMEDFKNKLGVFLRCKPDAEKK